MQSVQTDTLTQILRATRVRAPVIADLRIGTNVSVGLPALGGLPFHYVVNGVCRIDAAGEQIELKAGDFIMLTRIPYYRCEAGDGTHRIEVLDFAEQDHFSLDNLQTGRDHLLMREFGNAPMQARIFSAVVIPGDREGALLMRDLPPITLLSNVRSLLEPWLIAAIDFMSAEVESEPGLSAISERLIEVIFIAMLRKWFLTRKHDRGWMRGLTDPAISRVINAIHTTPGKHWTLHDLAIVSGRSRSSLAKHFHDIMEETPFAYLTRWRMHLASLEVVQSGRSVAEIGATLGYKGSLAFSRAFFATFGETPAQYKRSRRGKASDATALRPSKP